MDLSKIEEIDDEQVLQKMVKFKNKRLNYLEFLI
jgi:hypothetical protein